MARAWFPRVGLHIWQRACGVTRSSRRGAWWLTALAAAASANGTAYAEATTQFDLQWHVPEGCPKRDAARDIIDQALGDPGAAGRSRIVVRVTITELERERWNADIWLYGAAGSGERSVAGASCAQVAQAAALIVALAIAATPGSEHQAATAPNTRAQSASNERTSYTLGAAIVADFGSLPRPQPDPGVAIELGVQSARLRAELALATWLPRSVNDDALTGSGGDFNLLAGAVRGCLDVLALPDEHALRVGPCLGVEVGTVIGRGFGLSKRQTTIAFWGLGSLGLAVNYLGWAPLRVGGLGELGVPAHRPAWHVDGSSTIFRAPGAVARISFAVGWMFP